MKKPDIDDLIDRVRRGDGVAISIVKAVLEQYYTIQEELEKARISFNESQSVSKHKKRAS